IVVGTRVGRWVVLDREIHIGQGAVRLIGAHDVVTGRHAHSAGGERLTRRVDLDALMSQIVDHGGYIERCSLDRGNDPGVHRARATRLDGVFALDPEILEIQTMVGRYPVEREQDGRLLDVGVVARPPIDRRQRWIRAIPLMAGDRRPELEPFLNVWTVALYLVEAPEAVVGDGDPK